MSDTTGKKAIRCLICGGHDLKEIAAYRDFIRVTSDCKPWPRGGELRICQHCGHAQVPDDERFLNEINAIYASYCAYHQSSDGTEQKVLAQDTGAFTARSHLLLQTLKSRAALPDQGRMLDIGCGNGPTLRAFSSIAPQWTLAGCEIDDRNRSLIESIPNVEKLYTCAPAEIPGKFDVITMSHVLEHWIDPVELLRSLHDKLNPGGLLVILVPGIQENPVIMLVADHRSHFVGKNLNKLIRQAGYDVLHEGDWVPKELAIVGRTSRAPVTSQPRCPEDVREVEMLVTRNLAWLTQVKQSVQSLLRDGALGLFGTSIAATWLASEIDCANAFFVDEDKQRQDRTFMGRPVFSPERVPVNSRVFVFLPPKIAANICRRLQRDHVLYHAPPALENL